MARFAPLLVLAFAPEALALPIASFSQTTPNSTPFSYQAASGAFTAQTTVNFDFLTANSSGAVGSVPATLTLTGQTSGPVTSAGGVLIENVQVASFSLRRTSDNANLLSGTLSGVLSGSGTTGSLRGSEAAGNAVTFTSDFQYNLGGGLVSLGAGSVALRDASLALSAITPGPLASFGDNLSGSPPPVNFSASLAGVFAAVPEPTSLVLASLGLLAALGAGIRRSAR